MSCIKDKNEDTSVFPPLKHSPSNKGFSHLACDGVYRAFSSKGEVIDYRQMSPEELQRCWNSLENMLTQRCLRKEGRSLVWMVGM
ncbi:hypothetical protein BDV25DRAFT_147587 [Aspergillus avenaceus]|uniref:Uncharacterized protein n=1 Tax=Aspergillus avenaceus TaxID=36643 RepID=A0A5N6U7L3_ASPAV|nr:hypothetical protein BDV25DRAFT_147587 [Aspergillus avenaceus]